MARRNWKRVRYCGQELVNLGNAFQVMADDHVPHVDDYLHEYLRVLERTLVTLRQALLIPVLVLVLATPALAQQLNPWIERPVPEAQQWQWHLENEQRQEQIEQLEEMNRRQQEQFDRDRAKGALDTLPVVPGVPRLIPPD